MLLLLLLLLLSLVVLPWPETMRTQVVKAALICIGVRWVW
jgi:hypothetical protein